MRKLIMLTTLVGMLSTPAWANADLARAKNCMACHAVQTKVVGPAFTDVSNRYAGQPGAEARLVEKVLKGGSGSWGAVPMPSNGQVTPAEAKTLVHWVLSLR